MHILVHLQTHANYAVLPLIDEQIIHRHFNHYQEPTQLQWACVASVLANVYMRATSMGKVSIH